jgi:type IV pilus assembly protein PilM
MAKRQVSLHIDDAAIRVMVSKGWEPVKWSSMVLEPGLVKDGMIQDQAAVVAKIRELWQAEKLGGNRKVVVGVSGMNCLYQLVTLPELPENLLPEAVAREATHNLGIEIDQVYLSWQILSVDHGQMKIYLTVMSRDMIDGILSTLQEAGLKAYMMDIKPLCLARVSSEPRAVLVDTQPGNFDVVVLADGIPEVVRSLSFPEDALLGERTALLKGEMDRAIVFYNSAHMDKVIDLTVPILVSGELAHQEGEWEMLRGPRERTVRVLESPMMERADFDHSRYVTTVGLALKEVLIDEVGAVSHSIVNFNALPGAYMPRKQSLAEAIWLPTVIAGIVLVAAGIGLCAYVQGQSNDLAADLKSVEERIVEQKVTDDDVEALDEQVKTAQAVAEQVESALAGWDANRDLVAGDLWEVYDSVPEGMSLDSVARTETGVNLSGTAANESSILAYARTLWDGGRFSMVDVNNITQGDGSISFTMMLS